MSIRQLFLAGGLTLALTLPAARAQTPPAAPLTLLQALQAASDNLEVALAQSGLEAARADVLAANHAPLPVLSGKLSQMDLQNGLGGGNFWSRKRIDKALGVDWTWERGNKRALRTRGAQRAVEAAQSDLEEVTAQQLLAAHAAFFDLLAAQERLVQVGALERSASELASAAARRLKAGDLSAQDAARTDIEAQRARADLQAARLERERAALALRLITGVEVPADQLQVSAEWPDTGWVAGSADPAAVAQSRPDVRAAQARVQAAQAALDGAQALRRSDITWGASYDHFPGTSTRLIELRAQMPLQWRYEYQGEIGRAQALATQAQDAYDKTLYEATIDLLRLRAEAVGNAERARRYDNDILPNARRVAEGAELAYGKGALSLTDLLDARRTLRATQIEALTARADAAKAAGAWQLRVQPEALLPTPTKTETVK